MLATQRMLGVCRRLVGGAVATRRLYSLSAGDLSKGAVVDLGPNKVCRVEENVVRARGRGRSVSMLSLTNLFTGAKVQESFGADAAIEVAEVSEKDLQFLYATEDGIAVMDMETYDEIMVPSTFSIHVDFIESGSPLKAQYFRDRVIDLKGPDFQECEVIEAPEVDREGTKNPGHKRAVLDNGASVSVPAYIGVGERVKVDLRGPKPEFKSRVLNDVRRRARMGGCYAALQTSLSTQNGQQWQDFRRCQGGKGKEEGNARQLSNEWEYETALASTCRYLAVQGRTRGNQASCARSAVDDGVTGPNCAVLDFGAVCSVEEYTHHALRRWHVDTSAPEQASLEHMTVSFPPDENSATLVSPQADTNLHG
eukprot:CAMPEP_0198735134 /NCGR_PEP_ID=MMETSP1475-20131203/57505_1 /TAXON_ID= ORGANISM="Unidentified sp., Strain CCMP1999" /NCGR_SAMPLE_ID=MMETSP1475 /ASSEMBLY_ACC=CAM_ASM_001111 /LENGTH=366 /DNA_ID=CAMNT_0044498743 /DNA_START=49 /DNA_END=1147 /DNA_ORIENTATION=-